MADSDGTAGNGPAEADWSAWMAAAQAGDQAAYGRLLRAVVPWLTRYFARRLPSAAVDDTVQDTLLAMHEKRHTYDPARPLGPWLAAIARHKWIDRLRHARAHPTEALPLDVATPDHGDTVIGATSLDRLLRELKPAQAAAIRLVKLEGRSVNEASALTGQSNSLVKVNIFRGLRILERLVREGRDAD